MAFKGKKTEVSYHHCTCACTIVHVTQCQVQILRGPIIRLVICTILENLV